MTWCEQKRGTTWVFTHCQRPVASGDAMNSKLWPLLSCRIRPTACINLSFPHLGPTVTWHQGMVPLLVKPMCSWYVASFWTFAVEEYSKFWPCEMKRRLLLQSNSWQLILVEKCWEWEITALWKSNKYSRNEYNPSENHDEFHLQTIVINHCDHRYIL